jgi:hypothetical protein
VLNTRKFTWTELPFYLTYHVAHGRKLNFDLMGGMSYAMISSVDAGVVSRDNVGIYIMNSEKSFPGVKNNLFVSFSPVLSWQFSHLLSVGVMPSFKYSLTPIIENERWVQEKPWFAGCSLSLKRRF